MTGRPDSPLWTNPASDGPGAFADIEVPDNLDELAAQIVRDSKDRLRERLRPYTQHLPGWAR